MSGSFTSRDIKAILHKPAVERSNEENTMLDACARKFFIGKNRADVEQTSPKYAGCFDLWEAEQEKVPKGAGKGAPVASKKMLSAVNDALAGVAERMTDEEIGNVLVNNADAEVDRVQTQMKWVRAAAIGTAIAAGGYVTYEAGKLIHKALNKVDKAAEQRQDLLEGELRGPGR